MNEINLQKSKGIILLGDIHEEKESQEEIFDIFKEIVSLAENNNCDTFFQLGDICDKIRLNCDELYEFCFHMEYLKKNFDFFGIIEGNHDKFHNQMSIISFLSVFGYNIFDDELIINSQFGKLLLGHWFVDKSVSAFGTHHRYTVEDLKKKYKFDHCFLGHQHDAQLKIDGNINHIGSARYVSFGENPDIKKKCVIINSLGIKYIDLKSPIPIYNVSSIDELKNIPSKAKVRYIFKSFISLKEDIEIVNKYKDKFHSFKKKIDFKIENIAENIKNTESSLKKDTNEQLINKWLSKIEDSEIKNILENEFKTEFKY